jgi:hypothetical protein
MADDVVATSGLGLSDAAAPSPTNSTPPGLHIPDSTQDQAAAAMWQILSKQVDRRCAAMEAKVAAALSRLPGPNASAPPPTVPPTLAPRPQTVRFPVLPAVRPAPPAARPATGTPKLPAPAPKPKAKAPAPFAPTTAPRVDDELSFPSLVRESEWTTVGPRGNKSKISFAGAVGKPQHLTKAAMLHQQAAQTLLRHTQAVQGRTPAGRPRRDNQARPVAPNTTEVTVIRFGGVDNDEMEEAIFSRHAVDLV